LTTGAGQKLIIAGNAALLNGGGSPISHQLSIVVDGVTEATIPSQIVPTGILGSGGNIGVRFETGVLAPGAHTISLKATATGLLQGFGNAQLQILQVLA
jgi:hypothetical protein